jgi:putative oxidoreductase
MATTVHKDNGPWVSAGGYECNLTLLAIFFAVADLGPGGWSLDEALEIDHSGPGWALAELAAGIAGTAVVLKRAGAQSP